MFDLRRARTRKMSVRSIIAVAGVAAATFGVAQATGTMANPTDAVTATGSQVATGNFYPTPLTASVACDTYYGSWDWDPRGDISWAEVPEATGYYVEVMNRSNNTVKESKTFTKNEARHWRLADDKRTGLYVRVYTLNGPMKSSGFAVAPNGQGMSFKNYANSKTHCEGSAGTGVGNPAWENTHNWDPTTPVPNTQQRPAGTPTQRITLEQDAANETMTQAPTSEPAAPSSSASAPTTTSPSPSITTPSLTTTSPTTTPAPTEDPKPVLSDTVTSGELTAGWLPGGKKVAVVDANGNELASGRVESGSTLHWHNGQLWIVGGSEVYRIMESPQDGTWKFYKDSGQNMPSFD